MSYLDWMVDRRRSEDYRQLSGHIPTAMYKKFKALCAERDVTQSEALEEALRLWFEHGEETNDSPPASSKQNNQ
ncbi:ribbon-helix-helix domain-containing protein [Nostoc sp. UHCC 0870]|jgi:3-mercaptopyruvate sulfurtransferase SseA|uniref:ribbon-helix-helix domain-containing protein n=1 Tax=Nostoc sp. UHCC 0870 TaxID=2914041 RepID=UPI001EDE6C19|nr:ribbon-helix-helix domain-containing protein [Nostoc sp. UHCC 0870]UKP01351.1 ribbon-helix-helix domain-containing protein [Nostoc sp. UHCC 0870]